MFLNRFILFFMAIVFIAASLSAQTSKEIEIEPLVKLAPGETAVSGECLTRQELDLNDQLNALRRPTVGVEGEGGGDDPAVFDPHYFVGTWKFEGLLPESPLGEAGAFQGTETIRYVNGCTYEGTITATMAEVSVTIASRLIYDRRSNYFVRIDDDSRGFELLKLGMMRGDPGGYTSHHWESPAITHQTNEVHLRGRTLITSPYALRERMQISIDGGPFTNFGTILWDKID